LQPGTDCMRAARPAPIVHDLRRGNRPLGVPRRAHGCVHPLCGAHTHRAENAIVEPRRILRRVAKIRVGLAESEVKPEPVEAKGEFIDQTRIEGVPPAHGQIPPNATHFAVWRGTGVKLGASAYKTARYT